MPVQDIRYFRTLHLPCRTPVGRARPKTGPAAPEPQRETFDVPEVVDYLIPTLARALSEAE